MTRFVLSMLAPLAVLFSLYLGGTAQAANPDACNLLRDPATRAQLSGSFERKLMIQCGEISLEEIERARSAPAPSGQLKPSVEPGTAGVPPEVQKKSLGEGPGADVRINNPAGDVNPHTTQSETTVAINGATVCAGYNDSGAFAATGNFTGFSFSTNGGTTWTDGGPLPTGTGSDNNFGDPSIVFSVKEGAFYFAALSDLGLSLWRSTSCSSWTYVGPIHVGSGDDKELMAVDNNPASPEFGRLYVAWTDFNLGGDRERVTFSNNGVAWSVPVTLAGSGPNAQGAWPAVAPNGDLYVAFEDRCFTVGCSRNLRIYRSTDGGATFAARTNIGTGLLRPERVASTNTCSRQALNGNIRNLSSPQIAIHLDGSAPAGYVISAVYPYDSDGAGADNSNVFYKRSTDGAATWSAEKKLNDDATTTDQWVPAVGVNATGKVVSSWYDRRLDPANNLNFDRFAVVSNDGGLTFGANTRISDVSSGVPTLIPNFDTFINSCYHGDYDQIATDASNAYLVWSDDSRLEGTRPDPDVYFDSISLVTVPPPTSQTGLCTLLTQVSFATGETLGQATASTSFVNIPDMTVPFTMGGSVNHCVKVEFSAFTFAPLGELLMVRALLDGVTAGSPSEVQFSGNDDEDADGRWARSHAFNFEFKNMSPGPHTITIQFRSFFGGTVFVHRRSVFVHHR